MHRFIDLFCGIGGFRVALEKQGIECVFSCDINRHARQAYKSTFSEDPSGDITQIKSCDIPKHDILCAGFPCQSFSLSGKHKGLNDDRGRLFYEIVRIAKHHKPLVMFLENVKHILKIDNGSVIRKVRRELEKIGYSVHYDILNSGNFGIPQKRERVYFVCLRNNQPLAYMPPKETLCKKYLSDILLPDNECEELIVKRDDIVFTNSAPVHALRPVRVGYFKEARQGERIYATTGHAITLGVNGRTGLYWVNGTVRKLHIKEAKQVMGFSSTHSVSSGRQGLKQLGNAVIPAMVERVFKRVHHIFIRDHLHA